MPVIILRMILKIFYYYFVNIFFTIKKYVSLDFMVRQDILIFFRLCKIGSDILGNS